jgi:hypothetical protein
MALAIIIAPPQRGAIERGRNTEQEHGVQPKA